MEIRSLVLKDLAERHPGLTKSVADSYCEAARVCLDRHHVSPIVFDIVREMNACKALAEWMPTDVRTKNAWANDTDTTAAGAYGVALVAVETTDGLVAVSRAENKTGADYYLAPAGSVIEDLESSYRLEVSGVDHGELSTLKGRLNQKMRQAAAGKSDLPAIAAVVGFSLKTVLASDVVLE